MSGNFPCAMGVVEQIAGDPDGIRGPFERIDSSKYARVFKCSFGMHGHSVDVYLKQYLCRSFKDILKNIFRPGRAKRSLTASILLKEYGFDSPEVIAVGEFRFGPFLLREFSITEDVADAKNICQCLGEEYPKDRSDKIAIRKQFIRQIGELIGKMHSAGICHGDLRPGNVLVKRKDGGHRFFFLDNERTRQHKMLPMKLRLKNLVQINMLPSEMLNNTDRMRFFKSYVKFNPGFDNSLAREVAIRTGKRMSGKI